MLGLRTFEPRRTLVPFLIGISLILVVGPWPAVATPGAARDFPVPTSGAHPGGIALGPDVAVWLTELATNAIGRKGPSGFDTFPLPRGGEPWSIVAGPDGAMWFTEFSTDRMGRITTSGQITEFDLTCTGCTEVGPIDIVAGPDGALWFTEYEASAIARITTSGAITDFPLGASQGPATSIAVGPDGALWFGDSHGIGRITTAGVVSQVWSGGAYAAALVTGPDGNVWFIGSQDTFGRLNPSTGKAKVFPLAGNCFPQEIASGGGALWATCYNLDLIERITTDGHVTGFPVPNHFGGNYPDTLEGITPGAANDMWFTEEAADRIGRISIT